MLPRRLVGIRLNLTTAEHPQSNGLVERACEGVRQALRHDVSAHQKDWDIWLPLLEFAMKSLLHRSGTSQPAKRRQEST